MDIIVMNQNFEMIAMVDTYESLLWTDRYNKPGDFEIYTPVTDRILPYVSADNYVQILDSEHTMIIEDTTIESNVETGDHIKIVGRSLESILDRRIVWTQTTINGNLQDGISTLLSQNVINPSIAGRAISNFVFEASTDTAITSLTMNAQYTGDNLLTIIQDLCEANSIGFKITLNAQNQFVFKLYKGVDRSYRQETLPHVVFKPSFDNIINSNYSEIHSSEKNVTLIAGEGEDQARITRVIGDKTGLLRREVYTDARDIQKEEGMSDATYNAMLDERGNETLKENKVKKSFDGECETTRMYVYQRDFNMGDCVQVANEYGMESPTRIIEYIWSSSSTGTTSYPTFEALDYEEA